MTFELWDVVKIGVPVLASWFLGRRSKRRDELRDKYMAWASAAHVYLNALRSARQLAEAEAKRAEVEVDLTISVAQSEHSAALGDARKKLEQARFAIGVSDEDRKQTFTVERATASVLQEVSLWSSVSEIDAMLETLELFTA